MIEYDKLVRDHIPEIIRESGKTCDCDILSDEDFLRYAERKLDEELLEFHATRDVAELADLIEVIYAVSKALGVGREELEAIRAEKARKRGGFEKKIVLRCVRQAGEQADGL